MEMLVLEQSFQSNLFFLKVSLFYANYWGVDSVDASGKISLGYVE